MSTTHDSPSLEVAVHFFAAAAEAAGREHFQIQISSEPQPLARFIDQLPGLLNEQAASGAELARVCERSSFLINGVRAAKAKAHVQPGDRLDILPPFAGG